MESGEKPELAPVAPAALMGTRAFVDTMADTRARVRAWVSGEKPVLAPAAPVVLMGTITFADTMAGTRVVRVSAVACAGSLAVASLAVASLRSTGSMRHNVLGV